MDTPPSITPAPAPATDGRGFRRLAGLNIALLAVLAGVTMLSLRNADAQPVATTSRARGEYTMVSGRYVGGTSNAVYVFDAVNRELLALTYDRTRGLEVLGHRRLADDELVRQGR